jgi:hypothetical protein
LKDSDSVSNDRTTRISRRKFVVVGGVAVGALATSSAEGLFLIQPLMKTNSDLKTTVNNLKTTVDNFDELTRTTAASLSKYDSDPEIALGEVSSEIGTFLQKLGAERLQYHEKSFDIISRQHDSLASYSRKFQAPEPVKVDSKATVAAYYLTGWGGATRSSSWNLNNNDLVPVYGRYNSADPAIADWDIKYALEHGINCFLAPFTKVHSYWENNLEAGLMGSRFFGKMKFAIYLCTNAWWPGNRNGNNPSQMNSVIKESTSYIAQQYFNKPNYLKIDGRPMFIIYDYRKFAHEFGMEKAKQLADTIRTICSDYGQSVYLVGDIMHTDHTSAYVNYADLISAVDAVTAYNMLFAGVARGKDIVYPDTISYPYDEYVDGNAWENQYWKNFASSRGKGFIPTSSPCFSNRGFYESKIDKWLVELTNPTASKFKESCQSNLQLVDPKLNMVAIEAWNEYGEGDALGPAMNHGFSFLDAARDVFAIKPPMGWPQNILPGELYS